MFHGTGQESNRESDKSSMWQRFVPLLCLGFSVFPAQAGSVVSASGSQLAARCAGEMMQLHGVWRSPETFLPAYADWQLVEYLASLRASEPGVPVLPVFSPEPVYFRSKDVVFVSTGFILGAGSERELTDAIRAAKLEVTSPELPHCGAVSVPGSGTLIEIQRKLAAAIADYQALNARRLHRRGPRER